ncbi:MAG: hypothetical protein WA624_24230 [Methylocella sp.]
MMAQVKTVEYGEVFGVYILGFKKMDCPYGGNDERRLDGTINPDARRRKGIFPGTKRLSAMVVTCVKD